MTQLFQGNFHTCHEEKVQLLEMTPPAGTCVPSTTQRAVRADHGPEPGETGRVAHGVVFFCNKIRTYTHFFCFVHTFFGKD